MNRRKTNNTKRVVAWGSAFMFGSLIILYGYRSTHTNLLQNKVLIIEKAQTQVQPPVGQVRKDLSEEKKVQTQSVSTEAKASSSAETLSLKDFPSPVRGKILRDIGNYYSDNLETNLFHAGTDYVEPEGTIIRATHRGKVVSAGADLILGQKVTLDCGDGWLITYGCLDNLRVHVGDKVESQDLLGQVGFSPGADGTSGQSQLHYEIWKGDKVMSPVQDTE